MSNLQIELYKALVFLAPVVVFGFVYSLIMGVIKLYSRSPKRAQNHAKHIKKASTEAITQEICIIKDDTIEMERVV